MNLAKDFSIFLIFSKNQLYISLTLCNFFVSILSILALFDYFLLAPLFGSYSFCFRVFSCAQSFRYMISPVFYEGIFYEAYFIAVILYLKTAFLIFHSLSMLCLHFYFKFHFFKFS